LSGPRMVGGLAEHGTSQDALVCRDERVLRRDRDGAVTLPIDRGATQKSLASRSRRVRQLIRNLRRAGISPLARGRENPDPFVAKDFEAPGGCRPGNRTWLTQVQGRMSGRQVRAAMGGEKALERDPERSSVARKSGGRERTRERDVPMSRVGPQGRSEAAAIG